MVQPKSRKSLDIDATNRIIKNLTPYLFFEQEMSSFVSNRMISLTEEIGDVGLKAVAQGTLFFALNNTELGIDAMETAVTYMSKDWVTWRQYMQCMFWRFGPAGALDIAKRAEVREIVSPLLARDAMFYAMSIGDLAYMTEMHNVLHKLNCFDDIFSSDRVIERADMERGLGYHKLAELSGKVDTIHALSRLMFQQLNLGQKLQTSNRLIDVSESNEETSLIYELHIVNADSEKCAEMNRNFISTRVEAGLLDWDVGCMFISKQQGDKLNACFA